MGAIKLPSIFVVEDNVFYQNIIREQLKSFQYHKIEAFDSGEACLSNIHKKPDIVLLDHELGNINGIDVLKLIKKTSPNTKVIFLSGQDKVDVAVKSLRYGAFDYVVKNEKAFQKIKYLIQRIRKINATSAENKVFKKKSKYVIAGVTAISVFAIWLYTTHPGIFQ